MPITSSAKKALRASKKKKTYNDRRRRAMRDVLGTLKKLTVAKSKKEAVELLPKAYKAIDKAVKGGVIKKNAGARKKSRLTKMINKLS